VTAPVSLLPQQSGASLPTPTLVGLNDYEQSLIVGLASKLTARSVYIDQRWLYYDGLQALQNLGISVPPQLAGVRTVVDWPRAYVDPLAQRAQLAGFRLPDATEVDDELSEHLEANDMAGEMPLAILDSLVAGCGYVIVGSPDQPGDSPLITVESPKNLAMQWDPRTRTAVAAYQAYQVEGIYRAVLYLPNQTISMSRDQSSQWAVDDRDVHNFGQVPVVRLPNRARSADREGHSQITAPIMNTTDSACRTLLAMEIGREFYSIPHKYGLGLSEADFVAPDGSQKSSMDMAISRFLAFERDEEGQLPQVGQFKAMDPAVFTKILDSKRSDMASFTGFPASYFGLTATANPASADAIRVGESGIDRAGQQVQRQATPGMRTLAQLIWRFAHDGAVLPPELKRVQVDWIDARTPTPAATTDAVTKQTAAGILPPRSDVTLSELGYTPVERARIAQDWADDPADQLLRELGSDIAAKDVIAALRLLKTTGQPVPIADSQPVPDVPAPAAPQATPGQSGR
jgi:hypothetical protein